MKKIVLTVVAGAMMVAVMSCENNEKKAYLASVDSLQVAYDSVGKVATNWQQQFNTLFETCQADTTISDSVKTEVFEKISADWTAFEAELTSKSTQLDSLKGSEEIQAEQVVALKNYFADADAKLASFQSQLETAKSACETKVLAAATVETDTVIEE